MFNAYEMMLLSDVRDKFMKGLEISLRMEQLNTLDLDSLEGVLKKHPGRQGIRFRFIDAEEGMEADAIGRKFPVNPSEEFFQSMEKEVGIEVGLM
jgi:hypothetical protein